MATASTALTANTDTAVARNAAASTRLIFGSRRHVLQSSRQSPIHAVTPASAGLDPITAAEIDDLLVKTKQGGTTLVVVTHNIPSARVIGDTFAVLHEGRMLASGTIETLDASQEPLVQTFMHSTGGG